jgi:hypothetical protein
MKFKRTLYCGEITTKIRICMCVVRDVPKIFHAKGGEEAFTSDHARRQRLKAWRPT